MGYPIVILWIDYDHLQCAGFISQRTSSPKPGILDRFEAAETERSKLFDSQLRQLELEYAEIEKNNKYREECIDNSLRAYMLRREEEFAAQESRRLNLLKQNEAKRKETYRSNYDRRTTIYDAALAARSKAFSEFLDVLSTKNQWYLQTIEGLSNGPQRKSRCENLVGIMSKEFSAFLKTEQDGFYSKQKTRRSLIMNIPGRELVWYILKISQCFRPSFTQTSRDSNRTLIYQCVP